MALGLIEFIALAAILSYLIYYYMSFNFNFWKNRNVPGPQPIVFFGNMKDLVLGKKYIGQLFKDIYDEYSNEPIVGIFAQRSPTLIIRDLDVAKDVLIKDFQVFSERGFKNYKEIEPLGQHLFALDYETWKPLRQRLSPVFTSGKLKDMFYLIDECGNQFQKYVEKNIEKNDTVELRELTAKFTTDVIGSCAFGLNMNSISDETSKFREFGKKIFAPNLFIIIKNQVADIPLFLQKLMKPLFFNKELVDFFIGTIMATMDYRKKNNVQRKDFVDLLMEIKDNPDKVHNIEMTDSLIASQAFVFFIAGFETSSTTISNAMLELALNKEIQEKLRQEINEVIDKNEGKITYDCVKSMKYLDKVFKETLRKYPPAPAIIRKTVTQYRFSKVNVTIPPDTKVFIPVLGIHKDPKIYPNPEQFDPERFEPEVESKRHPMSFLAFGNGPRNCIGERFAIYQTKVGIIKLIQKFRIEVSKEMCIPYKANPKSILLTPLGGIHLKFQKI